MRAIWSVNRRWRRAAIVAIAIFGLIVSARERGGWIERLKLLDGRPAVFELSTSRWRSITLPHTFSCGGGGEHLSAAVTFEHRKLRWAVDYDCIPFLLQAKGSALYVACYDRSRYGQEGFRLFENTQGPTFVEIGRNRFPRSLAIQNMWLHDNDASLLQQMDMDSYWFRESLTGRLWLFLAQGKFGPQVVPSAAEAKSFRDAYVARAPNVAGE